MEVLGSENLRVAILLSTYNGARFLPEQLGSIAGQSHGLWRLVVRDDGSSDETMAILSRFSESHPGRVTVEKGANLGAAASFFALLGRRDLEADAVAFCDQDDVWHRDKLKRALNQLTPFENRPALYCSRAKLVRGDLTPVGLSPVPRFIGFENAIYENIAIGCTTMVNRAAHDLLVSSLPAQPVIMHDWWCYLVVSALGDVVFDKEPSIDYRLHGTNVVGLPTSSAGGWIHHAKRLWRAPQVFYQPHRQALQALASIGDRLSPAHRQLLEGFVASKTSLLRRVHLALRGHIPRQRWLDQIAARILIGLGLY